MAKLLEAQIHEEPSLGAPYPFSKVVQSMQGKNNGERKNRVKKTEDSNCSLISHFWSTFRSPFSTCYIPFQSSGSQQSNASNSARFGVEMKELQPLEAEHSKLKAQLRNQPWAAKMLSFCCKISLPSCTHDCGVLLKLPDICDRHFEIFCFRYLMSKSPNSPCNPPIIGFLSL